MTSAGAVDIDIEMGEMESELDPTITSFQASAIIAVCAAVLIGNGFVLALNCFKTHVHGIYLKFVMLSAAVNMISALMCMPLMAASLIQSEWKFGYLLCKMSGTIVFGSMILTMLFCKLAALGKMIVFIKRHFWKKRFEIFSEKDFTIIFTVFVFVIISLFILFLLIDKKKVRQDPQRTLCRYANSPNLTGYRMFYTVYSILLTFADLVLVIPIDDR